MVAYFKHENNILMALGGVLGALFVLMYYKGNVFDPSAPGRVFFVLLGAIIGVLAGRVLSIRRANRKLAGWYATLYRDCDPEKFLREFEPVVERVPNNLAEYADGCCRLSFAEQALGRFDSAIARLGKPDPASQHMHQLPVMSLIALRKTELYLMKGDAKTAEEGIAELETLRDQADRRASTLSRNLEEAIRLSRIRLAVLENGILDGEDLRYLEEEIDLSQNEIHKKEIQLFCAMYYRGLGEAQKAEKMLRSILEQPHGLYSEEKAEELLQETE